MRPRLLALCLAALPALSLLGCAHHRFTPTAAHGFHEVRTDHRFFVYAPRDWTPDKAWPVIVYLHGGGERGTDGVQPTQEGLGPVVERSEGRFPFVVLFPQTEGYWGMPESNARVLKALDEVMARYHGDPDRVYLTGNSLGGFGTWFLGALEPARFAALAPICGGVRGKAPRPDAPFAQVPEDERPKEIARRLAHTPVWAFHGAKDWLVPVKFSRELTAELKAAGNPEVRYTEYPDAGHNSWDRAYAEPELFSWLLAHRRTPLSGAAPAPEGRAP